MGRFDRGLSADLNTRKNSYVLIDEAHRTTSGDVGNFPMTGLPNFSYLGHTGTQEGSRVILPTTLMRSTPILHPMEKRTHAQGDPSSGDGGGGGIGNAGCR
ncbi:MAG TPA: hypothetical protein VGE21_00215 [Flavobacteriales bacterium]